MDKDTRTYRAHEFADLSRSVATGVKIKITAEHSEESRSTKWLNITAEELEDVIRLLLDDAVAMRKHWGNSEEAKRVQGQ